MTAFLWRTGRYAQVGLLCALINNAIVIGMDRFAYPYALSVTLGTVIGMTVAYLLHAAYTFRARATLGGWLRFGAGNFSAFLLSMALMFVMCSLVGLSASIAMPLVTLILFVWNYIVAHLVIPERRPRRA
jgi:putative flippase GtrA